MTEEMEAGTEDQMNEEEVYFYSVMADVCYLIGRHGVAAVLDALPDVHMAEVKKYFGVS